MHHETILDVIPGANPHERLVIAMRRFQAVPGVSHHASPAGRLKLHLDQDVHAIEPCCQECTGSPERPIVMRQESFSDAVGWFTQSCIELTIDQWKMMRATMVPAATGSATQFTPAMQRRSSAANSRMTWNDIGEELLVFPFDPDQAVPA